MASAAVIGMSFDTVTHDFQLTFTTAAMAYAKREKEENHTAPLFSLEEKFGDLDAGDEFMTCKNDINQDNEDSFAPNAIFEPIPTFRTIYKGRKRNIGRK